MFRLFRLILFHLKVYVRNQYFLWLPITSTLSIFFLQYLAAYAYGGLTDNSLWLRSAIFGLWTSATTATGSIGFQRRQGTLRYLINTNIHDSLSLLALILPASIFGLISFPLSYFLAIMMGLPVDNMSLEVAALILLMWLAIAVMDLLIAAFFVLTRNAIVYENLLHVPIMLLAGLIGSGEGLLKISSLAQWVIPVVVPIQRLLGDSTHFYWLAFWVSLFLWGILAVTLGRWLLNKAKTNGEGGMI
ncbi:multidrug ABC transporter permease [Aerococcus agrisoli]|uniref:Multidrug ABC transporter permease n=1 Tax=Aerococcus agrisoli TaxID=2487350 RepID=A0A3N4GCY2_9LACT|nr:multidrug ABC transporter permease [Aerococcus agrisoli]RPA56831.1 multidrug ABC transporter permease [Aerococcus agrisoli]